MEYRFSDKLAGLAPSAIREIFKSLTDPTIIAFAAGNPAPESFPAAQIRRFASEILEEELNTALQYSITEGYPALREAVADRLREKFSVGSPEDTLLITSGGQQGLELACKVMCDQGDTVLCENPSFIGALNAFRSLGANLVGLEMTDGDGIDPDALERALRENPRAKLLYLIPTFHNPAGTTMSLERRRAVYAIARRYGVMILEDNPYGELRFAGEEIPTIKSMDTDGIVIYCGSFSKILSAGMRVGFVCAPAPVAQKMVVAKQVEDVHTNIFAQMLCNRFLREDPDAHIASIRQLYRRKSGVMLSEMDRLFPESIRYTRPEGGLFLWCTLPQGVDMNAYVQACLQKKVAVVPGTAFNCDPAAPSQSFRLNYSTPSDEQIAAGIGILAETAREFLR